MLLLAVDYKQGLLIASCRLKKSKQALCREVILASYKFLEGLGHLSALEYIITLIETGSKSLRGLEATSIYHSAG